jgi:hypothetical protein
MKSQIINIDVTDWKINNPDYDWVTALESGKVLHFTNLPFDISETEKKLLSPLILKKNSRNISLSATNQLKGAECDEHLLDALTNLMTRFRQNATTLITSLAPNYKLETSPTSFRPIQVEDRKQSYRANDKLLHIDAFPTHPNYGKRILRVFININPDNIPRVWRIGEPFEKVANTFLHKVKPYSLWQASLLNKCKITKSLRSEYDHIMLQLHDIMKLDSIYQSNAEQIKVPFYSGSVWVCFSDQASHSVMSGQYMMEQTFNLPLSSLYDSHSSPLAVLNRITNKQLI